MLYSIAVKETKIIISNGNNVVTVQLPEGRSTRERLMKITEEYLAETTTKNAAEVILSYQKELLNYELAKTVASVFRRTLTEGHELGNNVFFYKGRVLEGGDIAHIHNLMYGLQNLFGYIDNTGFWGSKAMRKYVEREPSISYWERYAIRALIAYAKSVSLYMYGINALSIEELRIIYNTLCKECERKDNALRKSVS